MRLRITTPLQVAVDAGDVRTVRAEDATGAFGIRARHAPLVTVLALSVVTWREGSGAEHHAAVRGGVLWVQDGAVEIATPEAVIGDELAQLERDIVARFRHEEQVEQAARGGAARLETAAIRRIYEYLRGEQPRFATPGEVDGHEQG